MDAPRECFGRIRRKGRCELRIVAGTSAGGNVAPRASPHESAELTNPRMQPRGERICSPPQITMLEAFPAVVVVAFEKMTDR